MKLKAVLLIILTALSTGSSAQLIPITPGKNKGAVYLMWGYNRDWFSKSDIHFHGTYPNTYESGKGAGQEYDFTLLNVKAEDRPQFNHIADWNITIPQFYYRVGYYFPSEKIIGIEVGFDHVKYVMNSNQTLRVQGQVYEKGIDKVVTVDKDTFVTDHFVHFEHTNGANYIMLSFVRGMELLTTRSEVHTILCLVKPGAGIVFPRSDVTINDDRKDNAFHVAGYVAGLEVSFRYLFDQHVFLETAAKGCYANYSNVLTTQGNTANHSFTSFEWLFSIGYQFHL